MRITIKTQGFTVKRSRNDSFTFKRFTGIQIDGKTVPKKAYKASAGSLNLSLKPAYLKKLGDGSHSIKANFKDGTAKARFNVAAASYSRNQNDSGSGKYSRTRTSDLFFGSVLFWLFMLIAASGVLVLQAFVATDGKIITSSCCTNLHCAVANVIMLLFVYCKYSL